MSIDFEFSDPKAQEVYSAMQGTLNAVRLYRSLTLKDNWQLETCEHHMREALGHFEAGAGTWKVNRRIVER